MTKIYGQSDDLIEFDGDVSGEVGYHGRYDSDAEDGTIGGDVILCSDGTLLRIVYGKPGKRNGSIWGITVLHAGPLFERLEVCTDPAATPHSDVAHFKPGLKTAWVADYAREVD
jgi:hypothetical protein